MTDFSEAVNDAYKDALATFGDEGGQLRDVFDVARPIIRAQIAAGGIEFDVDAAIDAALITADQAHAKQTDRVIHQLADGWEALDIDSDPVLDLAVTLGKGLRKQWRHITSDDLRRMDDLRWENVRRQQNAYTGWRASFTPVFEAVLRFGTVGDAFEAGAFGHTSEDRARV